MILSKRKDFNSKFSSSLYTCLQKRIEQKFSYAPPFRIAETPVFFTADFRSKLSRASLRVMEYTKRDDFWSLTEEAVPDMVVKSSSRQHLHFACIDFAITEQNGSFFPKLIEVQGFPSLFAYQPFLADTYKEVYDLDPSYSCFMDVDLNEYLRLLKETILGDTTPEQCIVLDLYPEQQHTYIDFLFTRELLGIEPVCVTEVREINGALYYRHPKYGNTRVKRIYNRFILDEISEKTLASLKFSFNKEYDVQWVTAMENFYRVSKYMLPLIKEDFVPESYFLNQLEAIPKDLDNYVLKPLYSFSGKGLIFDLKEEELLNITHPENFILQRKVDYAPVISAPDGSKSKAEVRVLALWPEDKVYPILAINLVRLSKGKMIGVKYNKDFDWVGGSVGFFDPS